MEEITYIFCVTAATSLDMFQLFLYISQILKCTLDTGDNIPMAIRSGEMVKVAPTGTEPCPCIDISSKITLKMIEIFDGFSDPIVVSLNILMLDRFWATW